MFEHMSNNNIQTVRNILRESQERKIWPKSSDIVNLIRAYLLYSNVTKLMESIM